MAIATINPATAEMLRSFDPLTEMEIESKLERATEAFRFYRRMPFPERARLMMRAAEILETGSEDFGRLMTVEMGKPLRAAVEEEAKCGRACRYYAENAERFLADEAVTTNATRSFVHYQPIGPVLAIMPWNFPFWQVFRFAAPALMAGNVALLKHSSNVPQCALTIEEIFRRAGFPIGTFQALLIGTDQCLVFINGMVASDRLPFGGVKRSGYASFVRSESLSNSKLPQRRGALSYCVRYFLGSELPRSRLVSVQDWTALVIDGYIVGIAESRLWL
jgi:succinate-semialdehyde dehydrogenase/glutarate-semialdehyde dehydrogenase